MSRLGRAHNVPRMRIPSPDALLVDAVDALLAAPQRRGVPLPAILGTTEFAPSVGLGLIALTISALVSPMLVACWVAVTLGFGGYAFREALDFARDARSWDEAAAARYRSQALAAREGLTWLRAAFLAIALGLASVCGAFAASLGPLSPVTLCVGAHALAAGGMLFVFLCYCAMPRDPDLRERSAAPHAA